MRKLIYILFLFFACVKLDAQVFSAYLEAGDEAYDRKDYYQAMSYYGEALEYEENEDLLYKYADAAFAFDAYSKASNAFDKIITNEDHPFFKEALFKNALVNKLRGDYNKSIVLFERFINLDGTTQSDLLEESKSHLEDCLWALEKLENVGENLNLIHLNEKVNTQYSELSPYADNDHLFYTSSILVEDEIITEDKKIFIQSEDDFGMLLDGPFNNDFQHAGNLTFNENSSRAYFTVCQDFAYSSVNCQLYYCEKQDDDTWGAAVKLPEQINLKGSNNTQPSIGKNPAGKEVLFFVSNRNGGLGANDIWFSEIINNEFSAPQNLKEVNTEGDEYTPFYHQASNSIYFSTNGRRSLGGFDVYKLDLGSDKKTSPEHLALPINSSYNDLYFFLNKKGDQAHFSSNRLGSNFIDDLHEACCYDIYKVDFLVEYKDFFVQTFDAESKEALKGTTLILSSENESKSFEFYNENKSKHSLNLALPKEYKVNASKEGYLEEIVAIQSDSQNETINIYLKKMLPESFVVKTTILSFDNKPLFSTKTCIENLSDGSKECFENKEKYSFSKELSSKDDFLITTERIGYETDSLFIYAKDFGDENTELEIKLKRVEPAPVTNLSLNGYLPLPLFFDNDKPDSRSLKQSTSSSYQQTYDAYYARKEIFKKEIGAGLSGEGKFMEESKVNEFFDLEVKGGFNALDGFTNQLLKYLQQNNTAIIVLKGYASPRANSDYNNYLTMRRVSSVRNHFQRWNGGALLLYLNNGSLKIIEESFGETGSSNQVSDDLLDKKNSIYSIEASQERRVEIIEIKGNK